MTECVRANVIGGHCGLSHFAGDDLPHGSLCERSERPLRSNKQMATGGVRSCVLQITENRLANFELNRILLRASALCSSDPKSFVSPIKIVQTKIGHLAAPKPVDDKHKNHCPGAQI